MEHSFICVCAPEQGKTDEMELFYDKLQDTLDRCNKKDYVIIGGDHNANVRNKPSEGIVGLNDEGSVNHNGKQLRDFARFNNMRIMNSFLKRKRIHKITWAARGQESVIDYLITNQKTAELFKDTRVLRGAEVGTATF
ncbi:uncharacterized protein LOC142332480 [Lycorma delicatula]|uniref:uncharacterized protein LOC142332480 n=1 Tax=Lycorma delicatula TaxID=130591 RepID=UPI003F518E1E